MKKSSIDKFLTPYLENRQLFYSFLRPQEALLFQKYLPFKKPILDYGCGDGFFAKVAFKKQKKIEVGLDVNEKIKREAEESGAYEKVVIYDEKKIPFPGNYFSTIVSNCVLEHISNLEETLKELNRELNKDGRIYLTVVTDQWQKNLIGGKVFGNVYRNWFKKIQHHCNLLSKNDWEAVFRKNGFIVGEVIPYLSEKNQSRIEIFHYLFFINPLLKKILKKSLFCQTGKELKRSLLFFELKK